MGIIRLSYKHIYVSLCTYYFFYHFKTRRRGIEKSKSNQGQNSIDLSLLQQSKFPRPIPILKILSLPQSGNEAINVEVQTDRLVTVTFFPLLFWLIHGRKEK